MEDRNKRIQRFLIENKKYLSQQRIYDVKENLSSLNDEQLEQVEWIQFKDPIVMLLIAIFLGQFRVDRFMLGDKGKGVLKLVLMFLLVGWIWWIIDLFTINERTYEYNYNTFLETISYV